MKCCKDCKRLKPKSISKATEVELNAWIRACEICGGLHEMEKFAKEDLARARERLRQVRADMAAS